MHPHDEKAIKAMALQGKGQLEDAERLFHQILAEKPDHAPSLNGLGLIMADRDQMDLAMQLIRAAIAVAPIHAQYYNNLGVLMVRQKRYEDALMLYREADRIEPGNGKVLDNIGVTLGYLGRDEEAVVVLEASFEAAPDRAPTHHNIGLSLQRLGRHAEARKHLARAAKLAPQDAAMRWNHAIALLHAGDFKQGWQEADWRTAASGLVRAQPGTPLWQGQAIKGKRLLVLCEQGLGDNIQFVRLLPNLRERGAIVLLACPPPLLPLFRDLPGVDELYNQDEAGPPHDLHISMLDLPLRLGIDWATIPATVPYLQTDSAKTAAWRDRLRDLRGLKVGIAWRGNPGHKNDKNRSMTAAQFTALADADVHFVNLQKDATAAELATLKDAFPTIHDAAPQLHDLTDTASLIPTLDLVVAVDTSVCHLAGALGARTFTLLPFVPDWRWMLDRHDTPWYPTMRLFRQETPGDWTPVLEKAKACLDELK